MREPLTRHEPSPEFAARLESQLLAELRRRTREGDTPWWAAWSPARRLAAAAAVVLLSMGTGGAVVAVTYEAQSSQLRDQLVASYEQRAELARQRHELATKEHQSAQTRLNVGMTDAATVLEKGLEVVAAQAQVDIIAIDLAEIQGAGREPNHELWAPRVGGRDFVSDRLKAQQTVLVRSLDVVRKLASDLLVRIEIGTMSSQDLNLVRSRATELEASVATLERKMAVRNLFLSGRITGPTAQLRGVEIEMDQRITVLQPQVELARQEVTRVTRQFEVGVALQKAVVEARLRQLELETELSKAELELALIRERIRKAPGV
jgi:hypothetical protein